MILFLIQLSESDKKKIAIIAIILATLIVLIGVIGDLIKKRGEREGEYIDGYMYGMIRFHLITGVDQFKSYVIKREGRSLYFDTRWKFRIILILTAVFFLYFYNFRNLDFSGAFKAIESLQLELYWPTEKFFGLTIVSDWPQVVKTPNPLLNIDGYVTYAYLLLSIISLFAILNRIFIYHARIRRARIVASKALAPNLENINQLK